MPHPHDRSGYLSEDTISAITTEVGGAISVVRVSGQAAFSTLNQLTKSSLSSHAEARKLIRSSLYLETGELLDDALFVRFVCPQSYSGEDVVEYHIHGGGFIAHRLMEVLASYGVRQALPGEFSFRAVRNGKMTLFQAQAVADLIAASNESAVSLALEKLSGSHGHILEKLASGLRKLAVMGEVGIDFADQDIEEVSLPHLKLALPPLLSLLERLRESYSRGHRLQEGVRVAFVGLPNAGKSSFFNALLGENRSIVSEFAGTTRDIVHEKLTLRGKKKTITLRLEDTAGLRNADDPVEKMGIERTLEATQKADLILFIVDPTLSLHETREQWQHLTQTFSTDLAKKTICILTKSDLLTQEQIALHQSVGPSFGIQKWIFTSAIIGAGISEAVEAVVEYCEQLTRRDAGEVLLTRLDHLSAVSNAIEDIGRANQVSEIDLFASDIRQALHSLGPLIGETLPDDILGKIFSDFCIGK